MEEQNKMIERELMPLEEFKKYVSDMDKPIGDNPNMELDLDHYVNFEAVKKFKSVRRAFRRGHISPYGVIYPKRPFSNKKPTKGRAMNELKKKIYGQLKAQGRIA